MTSDYLKDFYSFYFTGKEAFYQRFMDEFNSCAAQLELVLDKENNEEGVLC